MTSLDDIRIAVAHPMLSQPLGCDGNALVIASRARRRGIEATIEWGHGEGPIPEADIYLIGGQPTLDERELANLLQRDTRFMQRVSDGAPILGVNAGLEILGRRFETVDGREVAGLDVVPVDSYRGTLAEGPVVTYKGGPLDLPAMSGFEAHSGRCSLGTGVEPLSWLEIGVGNGDQPATDGFVAGRVVGTYIHGPVLARNPELADVLLGWAVGGSLAPLEPLSEADLRRQRISEDREDPSGWGGREYGSLSLRARLARFVR